MNYQFVEYYDEKTKYEICKKILSDLPLWFGIQESNNEYCENVKQYRLIAILVDNVEIGFVSIKENSKVVNELYVLGLLKNQHRNGIGTKVLQFIEADLINKGIKYLEVKTLDESRESEEYRLTRLFYEKNGFIKLDVLLNEWGENNPCLIMIKKLSRN